MKSLEGMLTQSTASSLLRASRGRFEGWSLAKRKGLAFALCEYVIGARSWVTDFAGHSMGSAMPHGTVLAIEPLPDVLRVGDLLAFVPSCRVCICCHRVMAIAASGAVLTRGDGNPEPDEWVDPEQHVGVVRRFRVGGRWYSVASTTVPSRYRRLRHRAEIGLRRLSAELAA